MNSTMQPAQAGLSIPSRFGARALPPAQTLPMSAVPAPIRESMTFQGHEAKAARPSAPQLKANFVKFGGDNAFRQNLGSKSPELFSWYNLANGGLVNSGRIPYSRLNTNPGPLPYFVGNAAIMAMEALASEPTLMKEPDSSLSGSSLLAKKTVEAFLPGLAQEADADDLIADLQAIVKQLSEIAKTSSTDLDGEGKRTDSFISNFLQTPSRQDFSVAAFLQHIVKSADTFGSDQVRKVAEALAPFQPSSTPAEGENPDVALFKRECKSIEQFSTNLTEKAHKKLKGQEGLLPDVLLRREAEDRMMTVLANGGDRTSILLNEPSGEGKTFAVYGLAQRIAKGDVPKELKKAQLVQLNTGALVAGSRYRGDFEERVTKMFENINKFAEKYPDRRIIIFIDEMHSIAKLGGAEGATNLVEMMKSAGVLENPNVSFIGATTPDDWRESPLSKDHAVEGRFTPLALPTFNRAQRMAILAHGAGKMEDRKGVQMPLDTITNALDEATSQWGHNALRRAGDMLGLSAAIAARPSLEISNLQDKLSEKEIWLAALQRQQARGTLKGSYKRQLDPANPDNLPNQVASLNAEIAALQAQMAVTGDNPVVTDRYLRQAKAILTGVDLGVMSQSQADKILNAREIIGREIIGQSQAIDTVAEELQQMLVRKASGRIENRPISSDLMVGPTGVGKTEINKVVAREFFDGNMKRLDMSEYSDKYAVSKLNGAPPGYVGYDDGGVLTNYVRENPHSVIVFDEIEKADPAIWNVLLQILEEGELSDQRGPVSFRDTRISLTSNLSQQELVDLVTTNIRKAADGKGEALNAEELEDKVRELLTQNSDKGRQGFRPEQMGRIDHVIAFNPLGKNEIGGIFRKYLDELNDDPGMRDNNLQVQLSPAAEERLIEMATASVSKTSDRGFGIGGASAGKKEESGQLRGGARDVRRLFQKHVRDYVYNRMLPNRELAGLEDSVIRLDYNPKTQQFTPQVSSVKPANPPAPPIPPATLEPRTIAFG